MKSSFSPRETVSELDKFIIGQKNAKRAVSVALRNRWRRKQLEKSLRDEIVPKNILMVGPTGCGKTEISRRLAKLADAPFVKVEATKFTEVGYVGRDVEQIIRDLVEIEVDMREYEILVHMYSSNVDFTISFLDDVIRAGDTVAKKVEIRKSRAIIEALKRDLASSKNASIMSAFSDRINSEYYKIASLDNDLPYFIFVLDTPRSSPYPISPNILFIILANLIIFTVIGIFVGFFQKNKNDLW